MTRGHPTPEALDRAIGANIRAARIRRGMTQGHLASAVGASYQACHKWEHGRTRVSAVRLLQISDVLAVSPAELLDVAERPPTRLVRASERRALDAARLFAALPAQRQQAVLDLMRALSG